jgi:hypothetical protein
MMPHPLVAQLRFTRDEFVRGLTLPDFVGDIDAQAPYRPE